MNTSISIEKIVEGKILLIDKPFQWTSFDVVKKIRVLLKNKFDLKKIKVGHAGTLDPLATGLLIVCTGKATKKIQYLIEDDKEYIAEIKLGATTPSFDLETEIDKSFEYKHISEDLTERILKEKFTGKIDQIPPLFSAKRIKGVRAYEYARKGIDVKLEPSKIEIHEIELINYNLPDIKIKVNCSKGTYIRSLARDIGVALKSGAHLTGLQRTSIGNYSLNEALSLDEFEKRLKN